MKMMWRISKNVPNIKNLNMKRSDIAFYLVCLIFGIFNNFHGVANLIYSGIAIVVAVVACVLLKKYDHLKWNQLRIKL